MTSMGSRPFFFFAMAALTMACTDAASVPLAGPGAETEREIQACEATGNTRQDCCENHALASCPDAPSVAAWPWAYYYSLAR